MSVLEKIAFFQNIRSEIPNQQLARELAREHATAGIKEIAANLTHPNQKVCSDCLKVLYEIGYLEPALIAPYAQDFLTLLKSKHNRMVWGAMIALATIASLAPDAIWVEIPVLLKVFEKGSVITVVWGVKLLTGLATTRPEYSEKLFPILLHTLETCIPRDVPTHAENMLPAIKPENRSLVMDILTARQSEFTSAQLARCKRVIKLIQAI
ncbi:MAG: hypothetical protein A2X25_14270 [Chloroflexi bacterium GWB2_49_20]|nr:MAG: hypothetical protein A2X25_14270 [Chloroflexi bacterium GWB2_49_20]OGN79861.1 MAG: hypothetical protein A2X26_02480 [Chloroflexi bacterium GWC2_49_37]OGN85604.1 MAG: hypothetical protein A2X27_04580 [Chloroflexi bacterium GWD2_49_16]HBG74482.1 hypothetical protein [Anaerolineae bacterium]HCC79645.1 hypothetical protein [Anaerolineae bacterium]